MTGSSHIAVFVHGLHGGGTVRQAFLLGSGFARRGHRVDLLVIEARGALAGHVPPVLDIVELPLPPLIRPLARRSRGLSVLLSIAPLARYLEARRPDALLSAANQVHVASLVAGRRAKNTTRLVLRISNLLTRPRDRAGLLRRLGTRLILRRLYPKADALAAVSRAAADDVLALAPGLSDRMTVIPNPVAASAIARRATRPVSHPWFREGAPPVILGIGRLAPQKDFATLVRAVASLRRTSPVRLVILGGESPRERGRARSALLALAERLGIADAVSLPGFSDNPFSLMARAGAFVQSSRWEGFGNVLLEAMACGCPVVATDCVGPAREILEAGRYGPLVRPCDPEGLAAAIREVLDHPLPRAVLEARARDFAPEPAIEAYLRLLAPKDIPHPVQARGAP